MPDTALPADDHCRACFAPVNAHATFCSRCGATIREPEEAADALLQSVRAMFGREFEVEAEIGRGSMAVVFAARDARLERRVAIKVLLPDFTKDPTMTARFLREARTVAALQHPHVVSVYGVRQNGDTSAILMQHVDGRGLDALLVERSPLDLGVAGLILAQAASGLQHAHEHRTVHRDVKPANVLIDRDGRAVVSDFGIALRDGVSRITDTGMVVGTMAYMSPEQRMGGFVGPASDQYALGVMAFELFAGRLPFTGTFPEVLAAHLHTPPPPLGALRPDLPASVAATVMRMLSKEPAERFKDLREPERVFRQLVEGESRSGRRVMRLTLAGVVLLSFLATGRMWRTRRREPLAAAPSPAVPTAQSVPREGAPTPPSAASRSPSMPLVRSSTARSSSTLSASPATPRVTSPPAASVARDSLPSPSQSAAPDAAVAAPAPVAMETANVSSVAATSAAARTAPAALSASVSDSRTIARQFVTMLNQRRWSEVDQLAPLGGDAALRADLVRLVRSAPEFAAGFESVASAPEASGDGFTTEFTLALEWRGGKRLLMVRLRAVAQPGQWRLAAFGTTPAA